MRLLAHELTHVVQQQVHGVTLIQRQCKDRGPLAREVDEDNPTSGLPPLVYKCTEAKKRGISEKKRCKRPSVGYAQQSLNKFLHMYDNSKIGCAGDRRRIEALRNKLPPKLKLDCWFGDGTDRATRMFQICNGSLTEDGKIGRTTWRVLERTVGGDAPPKPVPPIIVKREEPIKFLHLSDLHICEKDSIKNSAGFTNGDTISMLNYSEKNYSKHTLIITGDIIDNQGPSTTRDEFSMAYKLLKRFKGRIYLCPGNHDFGVLGNVYVPTCASGFDSTFSALMKYYLPAPVTTPIFAGDNDCIVHHTSNSSTVITFYALDTNLETVSPFDFACGEVGQKQLKHLRRLLASPKQANEIRILYFHHHPFIYSNLMELKDSKELRKVVSGKVDVVLFGHNHVQDDWSGLHGVPHWLASGASPTEKVAREISVTTSGVVIKDVPIK